jgi:EAL domain-containing protein (putative c-di-GMP-specific phosphodiesterase class I)
MVLMDVQMPEMDGLEATRLVREREKMSGAHSLIIALTAHAMQGDKERCLAGGMEGYIASPSIRMTCSGRLTGSVQPILLSLLRTRLEYATATRWLQTIRVRLIAAHRIVEALNQSVVIQAQSLNVSCSVGISMFPEHGADSETLVRNADAAMYSAKSDGRGKIRFFTNEMNTEAVERLNMDKNLRLALDKGELFLVYQPQIDIKTGGIIGFEALIRWQHPVMGLVSPVRFISIAENNGLIVPIGEWVLRTACAQAKKWQDDGLAAVPVAVNLSAVQFRQDGFTALVRSVLEDTGLSAEYLELELTESLLLSNADVVSETLKGLKQMGLQLTIDDFGTGYSSLSYLKQLPVNKLKIDQSFIREIAINADDAAITIAIINMAKSLDLKVIAEGVETKAQLSFLRDHECDEMQGLLFSKPISAGEADYLQRNHSHHSLLKLSSLLQVSQDVLDVDRVRSDFIALHD